ncbi:MAG: beta-lactamase family protein [Chitinophagaceae bacterium]|nr:beta-lactamase family protein [Chitinophagaceae bacterium]
MKKKFIISASYLIVNLAILVNVEAQQPQASATSQSTYKPAVFTGNDRIERMKPVFPIIDSIYKDHATRYKIPGLAFGIVVGDKLVHSGGYGYSNFEQKTSVTTSSVYRIASMTKSFVGMAILRLRDEGKLKLDDPVYKYIPEAKNIQPLTDDSPPITIRNLMTHSAGFPEDNPWGDRQLARTDEELTRFLEKGVSLSNIPGFTYEYSNLGFAMLGNIVSRVSGQHYEKYINENIFRPLGMNSTYWEYSEVPANTLTNGYRLVNGKWVKEEMLHRGSYGAMGGLLTSIEDFSKYISLHISAWPVRSGADNGIVKRSTLREMHLPEKVTGFNPVAKDVLGATCPVIQSYFAGLSWTKNCTGNEYIGHNGGLPGFGTNWLFLPQYGIGIVAFSNLTYMAPSAVNKRILDTLISLAALKPLELPASNILNQRKQQLVKLLPDWKDAETSGIFAENFFSDYFVDSLRKEAKELFKKAGRILRVGEMIPDNQLRGNFILEGEKTNIFIRFTLSPEIPALIQQYIIREEPKGK